MALTNHLLDHLTVPPFSSKLVQETLFGSCTRDMGVTTAPTNSQALCNKASDTNEHLHRPEALVILLNLMLRLTGKARRRLLRQKRRTTMACTRAKWWQGWRPLNAAIACFHRATGVDAFIWIASRTLRHVQVARRNMPSAVGEMSETLNFSGQTLAKYQSQMP